MVKIGWMMTLAVTMAAPVLAQGPTVTVSGRLIDINGTTEIPAGMFGVHATPMKPEMTADWGIELFRQIHGPTGMPTTYEKRKDLVGCPMVMDCMGDRYLAPLSLTSKDYEKVLADAARAYAAAAKNIEAPVHIVEFWNEPFLNWASRSNVCYDTKYYDLSQAGEDKPVIVKATGKVARHLKWRHGLIGKNAKGENSRVWAPKGVKEGEEFTVSEKAVWKPFDRSGVWTAVPGWQVYDPTQVSYWSGKANADFYNEMLVPYARALKEENPRLPLIAGWNFNFRASNFAAWEILYKPTIDASIQWIDGVNEHHYGTNPRNLAADYEMVVGYAAANHGKWIKVYNTEANVNPDPAVLNALPPEEKTFKRAQMSYAYTLRDILTLLARVPDKAASRTAHSPTEGAWGAGGDEFAFKLLKPLRGRLLETTSSDPSVLAVSSVQGLNQVLVVYNDNTSAREVAIVMSPVRGATPAAITATTVQADAGARTFTLKDTPIAAEVSRNTAVFSLTVPARDAVRLVMARLGQPSAAPDQTQVLRRQFFAREILAPVKPGAPLSVKVALDGALLAKATQGSIRCVLEPLPRAPEPRPADVTAHPLRTVTPGTVPTSAPATSASAPAKAEPVTLRGDHPRTVAVNGHSITLPRGDQIVEIAVPLEAVKPETTLTFTTDPGDAVGYRVNSASVVIDAENVK